MSVVVRNKTDHPRIIRNRSDQDEVQVQPKAEAKIDNKYLDFIDTSLFKILSRPNSNHNRVTHSTKKSANTSSKEESVIKASTESTSTEDQKQSFDSKKKNK